MNSIILFFRGIKASVKSNPIIYGIFLFFYIFTTITMIYVVGKYSSIRSVSGDYDDSLTTISVWGHLGTASDVQQVVQKYADDKNVGYIQLDFSGEKFDAEENPSASLYWVHTIAYAGNEFEMVKKYFENSGIDDVDVNAFISSKDNIILAENSVTPDGDTYSIKDRPFKVIKRIPRNDEGELENLISYNSVLENNLYINEINIKFKSISGYDQLNDIINALSADFPGAEILEPVLRDYKTEYIFSIGNMLIYLVVALSFVNIFYTFRFIYENRRPQYDIMLLYGCTSNKIILFAVAEIFLIFVVQSFVGIILFHFAVQPLIVSLEPLLKYTFNMKLYLEASGISAMFCLSTMIIEFIILKQRKVGAAK